MLAIGVLFRMEGLQIRIKRNIVNWGRIALLMIGMNIWFMAFDGF
jgi:hypothetical protein